MINYIKSELYRVTHMKGVYIFILCCMSIANLLNVILALGSGHWEGYKNRTIDLSFALFTYGLQLVFIMACALADIIFAKENKNDTLKNAISFGLSVKKLFFGKIFVTVIIGMVSLILIEGSYIGSACLLLKNTGIDAIIYLLRNTLVCLPVIIASVVSMMAILFLVENETYASWIWFGIFYILPKILKLIQSKFEIIMKINNWMIDTILSKFKYETGGHISILWTSNELSLRLILIGVLVSIIFTIIAMVGIDKNRAV